MKKNCNIIKDLLPLYVDYICSNDSKKLVEEHLKNCNNCQNELEIIKTNINTTSKNDINGFTKIIKKINFKIIRNSIIITTLIIVLIIPILYFCGNYEFTMEYDEDMRILIHEDGNRWNFQFDAPIWGMTYAKVITLTENNEVVNYIFITRKYTVQGYLESEENGLYGTAPNIDYSKINPQNNMKVYYTTEDMDKIENSSLEELKNIINNSTLIFDNQTSTSTINCTLNNQTYNYTLKYYKINNQIIESTGDENMPKELLTDIYSSKGNFQRMWFYGEQATEIINKLKTHMISNYGTCTIENK